MNFQQAIKKYGLEENYYPYAFKSLKILGNVFVLIKILVTFLFVKVFFKVLVILAIYLIGLVKNSVPTIRLFSGVDSGGSAFDEILKNQPVQHGSVTNVFMRINFYEVFKQVNNVVNVALNIIIIVLIVIVCIALFGYAYYYVRRNRAYERYVFKNDFKAIIYKKRILKLFNNRSHELNLNDPKVQAINQINKLVLQINTRQQINNKGEKTRYLLQIDLPFNVQASKQLLDLTNNFSNIVLRCTKGKINFGDPILSTNKDKIIFMDTIIKSDPYEKKATPKIQINTNSGKEKYYEYSFNLNLFTDYTGHNMLAKQKAMILAEQYQQTINNFLSSAHLPTKTKDTKIINANIIYTYDIPPNANITSLNQIEQNLNNLYKTQGITVNLHAGTIQILVPIPDERKDCINKIDIKTIYEKAFGKQ